MSHKNKKSKLNQRYGRLLVIEEAGHVRDSIAWLCLCDCGTKKIISSKHLNDNGTKSCGCLGREESLKSLGKGRTKHGMTSRKYQPKIYKVWTSMLARCRNPNAVGYHRYGGRGITVCTRWEIFENFYSDMGDPADGLSIDRIDNDGPYSPENCRWATWPEQCRNMRRNIMITFDGETLCSQDWAKKIGLCSGQVITWRLKKGWSIKDAVTTPSLSKPRD